MLNKIAITAVLIFYCTCAYSVQPQLDATYHIDDTERSVYEARMFLPILSHKNSGTLIFGDVRGLFLPQKNINTNIGLGIRKYDKTLNVALGGYYFYDRQYNYNVFHQHTIGLEILSTYFESRANFYIPINNSYSVTSVEYEGMQPQIHKTITTTAGGRDWEVGFKIPLPHFNLWFYGSIYRFEDSNNQFITGKKAKTELNMFNDLPYPVSISASYDYREKTFSGFARIEIPFCKKKKSNKPRTLFKPIVRDIDIHINHHTIIESAVVELKINRNKNTFDEVATVKTEQELQAAINAEQNVDKQRAIILAGDVFALKPIVLKDRQMIIGGNTELTFIGSTDKIKHKATTANTVLSYHEMDSQQQTYGIELSKIIEVRYEDKTYESIYFVNNEQSLKNAAKDTKQTAIMVENDIYLNTEVNLKPNTLLMGRGELELKNDKGTQYIKAFSEIRRIFSSNSSNVMIVGLDTSL